MHTEDGSIIYRCLNGDADAFGLLVEKYKGGVYALAFSRLGNSHDAEDAAQETFLKAYENLHKLRRWDSFASWLCRIALNLCKRWLKTRSRRPDCEFAEDKSPEIMHGNAIDSHRADLISQSLRDALDSLPDIHREVLSLHYFGGMTSFEISRFAGLAPATVRRRLIKARSLLKAEMLDTMGEPLMQQKLSADFTLRITEMVKHLKIKPVSRTAGLQTGATVAAGVIAVVLGLGLIAGTHNLHPQNIGPVGMRATAPIDRGEMVVKILTERVGNPSISERGQNGMPRQAFSDNFEDKNISDWWVGYYTGSVDRRGFKPSQAGTPILETAADAARSGSLGLRFTKDKQKGNSAVVISPAFGPMIGKFQVDLDFVPDNHNHIFWLSESAPFETDDGTRIPQCGVLVANGEIFLRSPGYPLLGYYLPDKSYHLTLIVDVSTNTFDVEMTGELRDSNGTAVESVSATALAFEQPAESISRLTIFTGSNASLKPTIAVDNISIRECGEDQTFEATKNRKSQEHAMAPSRQEGSMSPGFYLGQCYPNPFNPETWIPYGLGADADVSIMIFSSSGQLIRTLDLGHRRAGLYSNKAEAAHWDGTNEAGESVANGVYFYTIRAGEFSDTRKLVVWR